MYDLKYKTKSGLYTINSNTAKLIGLLERNIYEYGLLNVVVTPYGFYFEYHPDFGNSQYHIVDKIAYYGSHNIFTLYDDEILKTMKLNELPWYYCDLYQ